MSEKAKKCIYVVATPGYARDMCAITLPTIERYAERIGADFKIISKRKFPSFPINYERIQIYELGQEYDWNINIDADMLIGEDLVDPTERVLPHVVGVVMMFPLERYIDTTESHYFKKDGRYIGVVDAFVVTNKLTHKLWEPLPNDFSDYKHLFLDGNTRRISEYCLSQNVAKYGFGIAGIYKPTERIYHINYTSGQNIDAVKIATDKLNEWKDYA